MNVYFDNAATTKVCPEAAEAVLKVMTEDYGNPSSTHIMGRTARMWLEHARKQVADAAGVKADEVYFTSGGTESDNWAIRSGALYGRGKGRHIITTAYEHDAIRKPLSDLENEGYEITRLSPGSDGRISVEKFAQAVRENTVLATVMLVNNEIGAVNPIGEMSRILHRTAPSALMHTDAVQAFGKVPFTAASLGTDLITISSHKIHGPKGCGALLVRGNVHLRPLIAGGGQEKAVRAGTENLPAIAGFGVAAELAKKSLPEFQKKASELKDIVERGLAEQVPEAMILSRDGAPHILSLSLPGYRSEVVMNCLDADGICVSKSSACKKGARSHVLEAMNYPAEVIDGAIRVSFSRMSTAEEAEYFVEHLAAAAKRLRHR